MNQSPLHYLDIGACNWVPADWLTRFYPDDLPEDWQFSYYSNEFNQVFISDGQWNGTVPELLNWREEVSEGFRLYLEVTKERVESDDWSKLLTVLSSFNWGAVVRDENLLSELQGVAARVDLLLDDELLLRPLWQPDGEDMQLAILRSATALNPLQLRDLFEQLDASVTSPELLVFLDAPYETTEKMRQMCELYGW